MVTHNSERYQALKTQGLCPLCGKRPPIPGQAKCARCRDQFRKYQAKYHAARKAARLCLDCQQPLAEDSTNQYCPGCVAKRNEYRDRRLNKRREIGLCIQCGRNPAEPNKRRCAPCLKTRREKAAVWRAGTPEGLAKKRDGFACCICGRTTKLVVHHIDDQGKTRVSRPNNDLNNLITLCRSCHSAITKLSHKAHPEIAVALIQALLTSE